MLTVEGVRVRYGPLEALHGVSLTVAAGDVVAVVGRNGAGKSTLVRAVAGYLRPSGGRVLWDGVDVTRAPIGQRAAAGVMLIPDEGGVFRSLTVRENLEVFAGAGRSDLDEALDTFPDLRALLRRRAVLLSGGEQQMLALARALLAPWRLLMVDELSQGLAPYLAARLYAVLAELAAAHPDRAVVLAEPHPRAALRFVGRVHVLRRGELAATASPSDFDAATL
ncbi:ABC transporter ATP-binding protein [Catenulispora yoronensis]|uniref:ABC transporter ATP-binding protein n=1 Tax=Catenulispora yoronensis TaxID=450799 RepID=A0ABN2TU48_9ACTN